MKKQNWIWMPHAGHLIVSSSCRFHLNTYVGKYIVSTVGEYVPDSAIRKINREVRGKQTNLIGDAEEADYGFETIGAGDKDFYETMVFEAKKSDNKCCPYRQISGSNIEAERYATDEEAVKGHLKLCNKWSKK